MKMNENKENLIIEYRDMNLYPDFDRNYYSETATRLFKIGHDICRLMKWIA